MKNVQGLRPGSPVSGIITVPCSKSLAQRGLICASLASGTTRITSLGRAGETRGEDVVQALALVRAVGCRVDVLAPAAVAITGRPPGPHRGWRPTAPLQVAESGTLARLATAALAFCGEAGRPFEIHASGTLLQRTSAPLFAALRAAGVKLESMDRAPGDAAIPVGWPLRIVPIGPPPTVRLVAPRSSQEVSALLVAFAAYPDTTRLEVEGPIPSRPYLEMTCATLREFGVQISSSSDDAFEVRGPLVPPAHPIAIEPDASAAAVALAAGCLSGGEVEVRGLGSLSQQGDVSIVEHLRAFGCDASIDADRVRASGAPTRAAILDLAGEPDLAPVLAMIAARAALDGHGPSRLTGLATLPGKESSRIEVLASGLRAVGLHARAGTDEISISKSAGAWRAGKSPTLLDPHADHRMAFAFALLGLCVDGVRVGDATCVEKSWPGFWRALHSAGANTLTQTR